MEKMNSPIAQTTIIVRSGNGKESRYAIELYQPYLAKDTNDDPVWHCYFRVPGVFEGTKPVEGVSSFHSLVQALANAYSLFHLEGVKGKVFETGGILTNKVFPASGMTLDQFFAFDIALED